MAKMGNKINFGAMDPTGHSILPTYYWEVAFNFTGNSVYSKIVTDLFGGPKSPFAIRCTSAEIPEPQFDNLTVDAKRFPFPEYGLVRRSGQITLTSYDSNSADIITGLNAVTNNLFNPDSGEMVSNKGEADNHNYKFGVKLRLYRNYNEHDDNLVGTYVLDRCLFAGFNVGGTLSTGSSPDYFRPAVSIAYGRFHFELGKAGRADVPKPQFIYTNDFTDLG